MNQSLPRLAILLLCSCAAQAQSPSPQDFAYGQAVIATEVAPAYRIALPLSVYQQTAKIDLSDLRVFNVDGAVVPYSLSRPAEQTPIKQTAVALPLFPLHEGARIQLNGVQLSINSAGSAVNLQTQNGGASPASVRQYLLDARTFDSAFSGIELGWQDTAAEFTARLAVEVSEDLAAWHLITPAAPVANLHANGQSLIENRVTFAPTQAKFWRLTWLGAAPSVDLNTVLGEPAASPLDPARDALDVTGVPDPKHAQDFSFDVGAHPPMTRINLLLPEINTVANVELSSRPDDKSPWRLVTRSGFYRLKTADAEQQNAAIDVSVDRDRFWRAHITNSEAVLQVPPRLHVEWVPNELTFLARGRAPFELAYGSASAQRTESDLSRLPKTLLIVAASLAPSKTLGGAGRLALKGAGFPWSRALLWGVLVLAVVLLAWMAFRVSKEAPAKPV